MVIRASAYALIKLMHVDMDLYSDSFIILTDSEDEFSEKLNYLRNHAEVFLSMLNDMRRRLKELPQDAPTAQQYRYESDQNGSLHSTIG